MRSVLVCTDGSPGAKMAVTYARQWAEKLPMRVKVLFVEDVRLTQAPLATGYYGPVGLAPTTDYPCYYDDLVKAVKEQGQKALAEAREVFAGSRAQVEYESAEGLVARVIVEQVKAFELLCLGRHGEHAEWDTGELGATVQKVVRRSPVPVLVTPNELHPLGRLLVAYDGSRHAVRALRAACELATEAKLPMIVVGVAHDAGDQARRSAALSEAQHLVAAHEELKAEFRLLTGDKVEEVILNLARQEDCGVIVMGAYGESRIRQWLVGSVTVGVLVHTDRPVLLVQ